MALTSRPGRGYRAAAFLGVFFGAPVCAEYVQAYLSATGDAVAMLTGLLILGPLYGGAAVIIREVAVRTGRGWPGILLLATAFGVLQAGVVDMSMFTPVNDEYDYYNDMFAATLIGPLGIGAFTTLAWVGGHVAMSIGTPLALLDLLAPKLRGRPLLGRVGLGVVTALFLIAAALIHSDSPRASTAQLVSATLVAAGLVVLAMSPLGRPVPRRTEGRGGFETLASLAPQPPRWRLFAAGLIGMLVFNLLPASWPGVAAMVGLVVVYAVVLLRLSRSRDWSSYECAVVAAGALLAQAVVGILAPLPPGVVAVAKYGQNALVVLAVAALAAYVLRRDPVETDYHQSSGVTPSSA